MNQVREGGREGAMIKERTGKGPGMDREQTGSSLPGGRNETLSHTHTEAGGYRS